jgi:DNA invertase Pin-like site-specific DNA recombinase
MFQMLGVFAEFERSIIQERVRAGLRRAKSEGKQLGRPPIAPELEERIRKALNAPGRTEGVRKALSTQAPSLSSTAASLSRSPATSIIDQKTNSPVLRLRARRRRRARISSPSPYYDAAD